MLFSHNFSRYLQISSINMTLKFFMIIMSVLTVVNGLDNGLARTPPMGWMQWERFRCLTDCDNYPDECISHKLFRAMADHMLSDGYLDAGYEYVIIDDCWFSHKRDNEGRLQPDPDRFPYGIKSLADYIHSKGLKFGIYADYGIFTCAGYPGSLNHLEIDAHTFAEWGVDYLKFDGCYSDYITIDKGYIEMDKYLNATDRPIVYSCSWPAYQESNDMESNYTALAQTCNLWRNWDDIDDSWESVSEIISWFSTNQDRLAPFSGPGHWNDPDMLIIGNYGLSLEQCKAQMAIWSIMAAPLIMSVDLRTIDAEFRDIILNKEAISVNQDPLGIMGRLVLTRNKINIWTKPLQPREDGQQPYAIALMSNRTDGYPYKIGFTLTELNITNPNGFQMKDVFEKNNTLPFITDDEKIYLRMKPTGGALLVFTPIEEQLIVV
ncbi:alpha-N-acetylgalactosaminidase-like [Diorhabda sublineata]|uniref:alpha-N-acetylgalactosaminidase-like n=1 Tax=Diorhabda sublineata TaxID=1163346 RepID=UPI0024E184A1|nr:alpha-N-acetylgalactosaminidase-like [Diorhabda sublineata]